MKKMSKFIIIIIIIKITVIIILLSLWNMIFYYYRYKRMWYGGIHSPNNDRNNKKTECNNQCEQHVPQNK